MHLCAAATFIAAHTTTLDRLRHVPLETWGGWAALLVGAVFIYRLWRALKAFNDYAPFVACAMVGSGVFFYWVYTRTEPAFLTPIVQHVAPFFPSRAQQSEYVDRARSSHD